MKNSNRVVLACLAVLVVIVFCVWLLRPVGEVAQQPAGKRPVAKQGNDRGEKNDDKEAARKALVENAGAPPARPPAAVAAAKEVSDAKTGVIDDRRVSVVRGTVQSRDGNPLAGVRVAVREHPEFGSAESGADGAFQLAVNGGGALCFEYEKQGYLSSCRMAGVGWQDFTWLPEVCLVEAAETATAVSLKEDAPLQIARGEVVEDDHGQRTATVLIPAGTTAELVMSDGTIKPVESLTVRATEYTVGKNGARAMPAPLPATSAYTYAVELSADEATAAGGADVRFKKPVFHYVENFLDFPVGIPVPSGYFDKAKGAWIPAESGRIIQVLEVNNGLADLDVEGKGNKAVGNALADLGITDDERRQLAAVYRPGQSLWRVPIPHFSVWDLNWGFSPPDDATGPDGDADDDEHDDDGPTDCGSIIDVHNQILGEALRVNGTSYWLHYHSDRVPGRKAARSLRIQLTGDKVPKSLERVKLEVFVAGQHFQKDDFPPEPNQFTTWVWDGKDGSGNEVHGKQQATVRIAYVYKGVYENVSQFGSARQGIPISGSRTRQEVEMLQEFRAMIGGWDARSVGIGGWTLDVHHAYDPTGRTLYLGDGRRRSGLGTKGKSLLNQGIETIAGGGSATELGDGGQATAARLESPLDPSGAGTARDRYPLMPAGLASAPDGTVFIADENRRIRKVTPGGIISTVAGGGTSDPFIEGPALDVKLDRLAGLALGPDGSLYVAMPFTHRVMKVNPQGVISNFAGTGSPGYGGDDGPATAARLQFATGVSVGPDGSVFIADQYNHRIRRVWPDGTITTIAGTGKSGSAGDGGPALLAELYWPTSLAIADDGSIYVSDQGNYIVRRISPSGTITTVAGTRLEDYEGAWEGDGGPALAAKLNDPTSLALGAGGVLYIADTKNHRIRRVGPEGTISTFAGAAVADAETGDFAGDGGPAVKALLSFPSGLALAPDGSLLIHDAPRFLRPLKDEVIAEGVKRSARVRPRVRRVAPPLPGFDGGEIVIASEDGSEVYRFSATGQHLETRSTLTKALMYRFGYDRQGRLARVEDGLGNVTTVERPGNNSEGANALALLAPYGQRTHLTLDGEGYLASVQAPAESATTFAYENDGLLTNYTDAAGSVFQFEYDELGRLTKDSDPAGGFKAYERSETSEGFQISGTTATPVANTWSVERRPDGGEVRMHQCGCGELTRETVAADGTRKVEYPDGSVAQFTSQTDTRFGAHVSLPAEQALTTPAGRKRETKFQRSIALAQAGDPLSLERLTDTITINGNSWVRTYEAAMRRWTTRSPEGRETRITIDEHRRPVLLELPGLHPIAQSYDARGRLTSVVQGAGAEARATTLAYDDEGLLISVTDALKRVMRLTYDAAGRLQKQTLPDGREVGFAYDAAGRLTEVVPPGKTGHTFEFSPAGLASGYNAPEVGDEPRRTGYEYDLERRLSKIVQPDGSIVELAYNDGGRLATLAMPDRRLEMEFDSQSGQLKSIADDSAGALSYEYDGPLVTATTWKGPVEGRVARTFDDHWRLKGVQVNDAPVVEYEYDADGLPVKAGELTLTRDAANGGLRATKLDNITTAHEVNGFGESTKLSAAFNENELFSATYERDGLGRITRKIESIEGQKTIYEYRYDAAGRLAEVLKNGKRAAKYEYDSNGNRTRLAGASDSIIEATYDARDRLVQYDKSQYRYNALGQLLAKTSAGKEVSYKYDPLGNLQTAVLAKDTHVEYVVDGLGRRIGKKINGALKQGFLYREKVGPLAELDSENRVISRFVYAEQPQVPEYLEKEGERFRIVADPVGSPRCVVNAATGQIVQRLDYDPFGAVESDTNPAFQPFGFAGGLYDPDLGLTRMGFRDYDAETGRWTAKDPLGFAGGDANLYAYVSNNPPNRNDPWGLQEQLPIITSGTGGGIVINIIENRVPTTEERLNRTLRQAGNQEAWRQWNRGGGGFSPEFNIGNTGGTFEPGTVGNTGPHSEHDGTENFPGMYEDDPRGGPDTPRNPHQPPCETTYGGTVRWRFGKTK